MRPAYLVLFLSSLFLAPAPFSASAVQHQLYLDFDTDGDLWTINPYAAHSGVVSLVIEIGDDPIPAGAGVQLAFYLGCGYDPQAMEGCNCAWIECEGEWGTPGILRDSWVDCPPLADCWEAVLVAGIDPAFSPVPGERYLLGTRFLYEVGAVGCEGCEGTGYQAWGDFAGTGVLSNVIWLELPTPVSRDVTCPAWGRIKALYLDAR